MNDGVVGIGIDLTQHVPLVSFAFCPEAVRADDAIDIAALARHWPPKVEIRQPFHHQLPSALLPLMPGEPLLAGAAASAHRRSAGLAWPPEAQVPYASDPACGVGRIPLVAAWTALLPSPGADEGLTRRGDPEFKWCPEGREHTAHAGQILAASIKAFLTAAGAPLKSIMTAIVVPDTLDEAGQQILLDNLAQAGLSKVHLLPRPLAVALHWCHTATALPVGQVTEDEEGEVVGRLRILTMALDVWEAISLELRARRYGGRVWTIPVRNHLQLTDMPPELQTLGLGFALGLACMETDDELLGWWPRVFASDWLERRLMANRDLSPQELEAIREVCSPNSLASLRQEFSQLTTLRSLWSRLSQTRLQLRDVIAQRWEAQERNFETSGLPCIAVLADGTFADLLLERNSIITHIGLPPTLGLAVQVFPPSQPSAVKGAALAAAAIAHGLPCYRETLLPLDLCVRGTDEYGDPMLRWNKLVVAGSVEAGKTWPSPTPVTGLRIEKGQDRLSLPLCRVLRGKPVFRQVSTELATAATRDEPVRVEVQVKPGQGFARVRIDSVTPGVFAARLDWHTMKECDEPKPLPLAYLPGVSRVVPDEEMFTQARPVLEEVLRALWQNTCDAIELLRRAYNDYLNKWPLAHNVDRRRGRTRAKDFRLHYGIIGSDGNLDALPEPGIVHELRDAIGEKFSALVQRGEAHGDLGKTLLRAGGWFYLAMPEECFTYLRERFTTAHRTSARPTSLALLAVELHAIGLAFETPDDLRRFYPLVVRALYDSSIRPNEWLRAVRNICRFRNHALHPDAISESNLYQLTERIFEILQGRVTQRNFARGRIFLNCLETIPFLLKRRRYDPEFLAPTSQLAQNLIYFLEKLDRGSRQLPRHLQPVPRAAINFLRMEATESDIEALLSVEDEGGDDA